MDNITPAQFEEKMGQAVDAGRKAIIMFEDEDGNWRGLIRKDGKMGHIRAGDPNTVMTALITHPGE